MFKILFIIFVFLALALFVVFYNIYEGFYIQDSVPYWRVKNDVFPIQEGFNNQECYMKCPYPNPYGRPCFGKHCCVKGGGNVVMLRK